MNRYRLWNRITVVLFFVAFLTVTAKAQNTDTAPDYDSILRQVGDADQGIRVAFEAMNSLRDEGFGVITTERINTLSREMNDIDAITRQIAFPILDRYLASPFELSDEALTALYLVIQHTNGDAMFIKYQDFIRTLWDKKIIDNVDYARFVDRLNVHQNKAQVYGCQIYGYMLGRTPDLFLYPLTADAPKRRVEMGLVGDDLNEFKDEYAPIYMTVDEYVVFGHVCSVDSDGSNKGISATITFGDKTLYTNSKGFYAIKFKRKELPQSLSFEVAGQKPQILKLHETPTTDWETINVWF